MKRSRLVGSFTLEGAAYALAATLPGIAVGIGVGWAVAVVSAQIFRAWSAGGTGLSVSFAVTPTSIVNGAALGPANRTGEHRRHEHSDQPVPTSSPRSETSPALRRPDRAGSPSRWPRRWPSCWERSRSQRCVASQPEATYLLPALTLTLLTPALRRVLGKRWAISVVAERCCCGACS